MTAYTFELKRTECEAQTIEAAGLQRAITVAYEANPGWIVPSVEWDGGSAEIYGKCEGCKTFCVCVFEDGGDKDGETNYEHDSEGVPLCKPCMAALVAAYEVGNPGGTS